MAAAAGTRSIAVHDLLPTWACRCRRASTPSPPAMPTASPSSTPPPRSLKFKLFELGSGTGTALKAIASGVCERIGDPDGVSYLRVGGSWEGWVADRRSGRFLSCRECSRHAQCIVGECALSAGGRQGSVVRWSGGGGWAVRQWNQTGRNASLCSHDCLPGPARRRSVAAPGPAPAVHTPLPSPSRASQPAVPAFHSFSWLQAKVGGGPESKIDQALPNHTKALELVSGFLGDAFHGVRPADGRCSDDLHRVWPAFIAALERVSAFLVNAFHRVRLAGLCIRRVCGNGWHDAAWLTLSCLQDFTQEVFGVGHRVVHGREISESVLIS